MTTAQALAFASPCREAEDTLDPKFYWPVWGLAGRPVSMGLTVSVGPEDTMVFGGDAPLWHASAALGSLLTWKPLPVAHWTKADYDVVMGQLARALRGVGNRHRRHVERGEYALHLRRPCTPDEIAALIAEHDEAWGRDHADESDERGR